MDAEVEIGSRNWKFCKEFGMLWGDLARESIRGHDDTILGLWFE